MDKLLIQGGKALLGEVNVSGSKNASLPILASALLAKGEHHIQNVPPLADIETMSMLLCHLGAKIQRDGNDLLIDTQHVSEVEATYDIVRKMRASILVLAPLLVRFGRARVSLPGGCAIGARPIDQHLKGLEAMGAGIVLEHGYVEATTPKGGLKGAHIVLDMPSVGATQQLMMAGALAKGTTTIENAAREPEIIELERVLLNMGAKLKGAGSGTIILEGVKELSPMRDRVGPDRIETGTLLTAAAITGGDILLHSARPQDLTYVLERLGMAGCKIQILGEVKDASSLVDVKIKAPKRLKPVDIKTAPYPGFPTDMQAQWMACMALANGVSHIEESIFENRFMHVSELNRMGANIELHGHHAIIKGVEDLSGAPVMATDLRASASLVLAGLRAQGQTEVLRIYHLDRGYVALEKKLAGLGAQIQRVKA